MAKIVLNAPGSPVQISVKKGVAKETGREYEYIDVVIGRANDGAPVEGRIYVRSPRDMEYVKGVLAEGADAILDD